MSYDIRKAFLADQVYKTDKLNLGTALTDPNGGRWELTLKWDSKTNGVNDGYQGALFKSLDTGKYEFASRGGKLDALDPYFNAFKLWLDINGDARTGVGELYGLAETGVQSIDVGTGGVSFTDGQTIALQKMQLSADVKNKFAANEEMTRNVA